MHADKSRHILFVEDHADTCEAMAELLSFYGHSVCTARSCAKALDLAGQQRFDVLVTDIDLPDGSGLDLLSQLRNFYPIPGIAVTGYAMADDVHKSAAAGFALHLAKPFDVHVLVDAVETVAAGHLPASSIALPR